MYNLGKKLREMYDELLGSDYHDDDVFAISSDLPRTKMSLQLVLAGLYPPSISKEGSWNSQLDWNPIPTNAYDFNRDQLFSGDKCDTYVFFRCITKTSSKKQFITKLYKELHSGYLFIKTIKK